MGYKKAYTPEQLERINASKKKYAQNPINIEKRKKRYQENKAEVNKKSAEYYLRNKEKIKEKAKQYSNKHKEKISVYMKQYQQDNADKIRLMNAERCRKNSKLGKCKAHPSEKAVAKGKCLYCNIRSRITNSYSVKLKRIGASKNTRTLEATGCTVKELYNHLESLFQPGMTWKNMGEWHIDHIKPLALAKTEEEMVQLCHYTNLQPLWAKDNIAKKSFYNGQMIKAYSIEEQCATTS